MYATTTRSTYTYQNYTFLGARDISLHCMWSNVRYTSHSNTFLNPTIHKTEYETLTMKSVAYIEGLKISVFTVLKGFISFRKTIMHKLLCLILIQEVHVPLV